MVLKMKKAAEEKVRSIPKRGQMERHLRGGVHIK